MHREVEEVSRFFQRIRAVRNDDALHVIAGEEFVHAVRKLQKRRRVHVVRGNLDDLFAVDLRNILHLRDGVDQRLDADFACFVPGGLGSGSGAPRNRAARGENAHAREIRGEGHAAGQSDRRGDQGFVEDFHDVLFPFFRRRLREKPTQRKHFR